VTHPLNVFWDSCCFIRLITRTPDELLGDMEQYVHEARDKGKLKIHFSTIAFVEIRPRHFKGSKYGSIEEFFAHWGSAFHPFEPNPNILIYAGRLRDAVPENPFPKADPEKKRSVGPADAIHLATCLFLRDAAGVSDIEFHSFDEGKGGTSHDGKCVPIIGFERWFPESRRTKEVADVCGLPRRKPKHLSPDLATGGSNG